MKKIKVKNIPKYWKLDETSNSVIVLETDQKLKNPFVKKDIYFEYKIQTILETEILSIIEDQNGNFISLPKEKEIKKTIRIKESDSDLIKVIK